MPCPFLASLFSPIVRAATAWLLVLLVVTGPVAAQTPPAWNTLFGTAIPCAGNACRITGGPGCDTAAVAGQCSFPRTQAQALCTAHGSCQALTCNASRNDCQARDATEAQASAPLAGFTSLRRVTAAQAAQPHWATQMGGAIGCGVAGNPACRISSGSGCNTMAVAGQCSFAAATAQAACVAHGSCRALTCNLQRNDCQARDAQEALTWVPNAGAVAFVRTDAPAPSAGTPPPSGSNTPGLTSTGVNAAGATAIPTNTTGASSTAVTGTSSSTGSTAPADPHASVFGAAAESFGALGEVSLPAGAGSLASIMGNPTGLLGQVSTIDGNWAYRSVEVPVAGRVTLFVDIRTFRTAILLLEGAAYIPFGSELGLGSSTGVNKPMFVLSKTGGTLDRGELPTRIKPIWATDYGNPLKFDLQNGMTVFGVVSVAGEPGSVLKKMLGAPSNPVQLPARWSKGKPDRTRVATTAENASTFSDWLRNTIKTQLLNFLAGPPSTQPNQERQLQLWMRPTDLWDAPMGIAGASLSGANVDWSSTGIITVAGNLKLNNKTTVAYYHGPYSVLRRLASANSPQALMALRTELSQLGFKVSTPPNFTLKDGVDLGVAVVQALPWFDLPASFTSVVNTMALPLTLVGLENHLPQQQVSIADPLPGADRFNLAYVGVRSDVDPLAPLFKLSGKVKVLGAQLGATTVALSLSTQGFAGDFATGLGTLNLGRVGLGSPGFNGRTQLVLSADQQLMQISGQILDRTLTLDLTGSSLSITSPATCLAPVTLSGSVALTGSLNVGQVVNAVNGVSVDPMKLPNCAGEALKKAYQWISGTGRQLAGFGAGAADAALELIGLDDLQGAAREALSGAATATTAAVSAGVNQTVGAAAGTASTAMDLGRDIGNFASRLGVAMLDGVVDVFSGNFTSLVGGKSTDQVLEAQCNKRTGWMIDRAGRPEVHLESFIQRVYDPLHTAIGKAHGLEQRLIAQHGQWQAADAAFFALSSRWNELSPAAGDVEGYRLRQQATDPLPANVAGRYQGLQTLTYVPPGGDTRTPVWNYVTVRGRSLTDADAEYAKWVGWRVAKDSWKTARYTLQILHRCVEADVANVPQRMAQKLGTFRPLNVNGSPLYEEMDRPNNNNAYAAANFAKIVDGLEAHVRGHHTWLDRTAAWANDFQAAWKFRTDGYRKALLAKMALGPWAQALAEHPASAQQFTALWSEYSNARLAVINQTGHWSDLNRIGTVADAQALATRVFNANASLRAAAIQYRPNAPADLQALIPVN